MSRGQVCKLWKSGKKSPKDNIAFDLIYREFQTCVNAYVSSNVLFFWIWLTQMSVERPLVACRYIVVEITQHQK